MTRTRTDKAAGRAAAGLSAAQPWLREHYATLHDNVSPRWESTRDAVAPAVEAANQRLRNDVIPAAARMSGQLADEAMHRTAPLRGEIAHRAIATVAAARGIDLAAQAAAERRRARRWKLWLIGGGAMVGAAGAAGLAMWQRNRHRQWAEAEAGEGEGDNEQNEEEAGTRLFEPEGTVMKDRGTDTAATNTAATDTASADPNSAPSPDDPANADAGDPADAHFGSGR
jgi:hypothetical protein